MRNAFCQALVDAAHPRQRLVFLTGDLGYRALEPLRDALGARFINAGVAEQNMVSVAAGLAKSGLRPWAYSIAPFIYARPFEQIRNDVCLHNLPVVLVGNGGGYGYGVMGATHHAIEDYGSLLSLLNLRAFVPAFRADVKPVVTKLMTTRFPVYLRLGLGEDPAGYAVPEYSAWRKLLNGTGTTILVVGPIVGGLLDDLRKLDEQSRPSLWVLSELPIEGLPKGFLADLSTTRSLAVVEEHVVHGGAGEMIARELLLQGIRLTRFSHHAARGYLSGRYGSQKFHRKECGLDVGSLLRAVWFEATQ